MDVMSFPCDGRCFVLLSFPDKLLTIDTVNGDWRKKKCIDENEDVVSMVGEGLSIALSEGNDDDYDESGKDDDGKRLAMSRVQVLYPAIESSLSCKTNNNNNNETHHDNLHSHKKNELSRRALTNQFEREKNMPLFLHA
eukprot:scaffold43159_cov39-Cyclotella_meneghiniana.AAC.2